VEEASATANGKDVDPVSSNDQATPESHDSAPPSQAIVPADRSENPAKGGLVLLVMNFLKKDVIEPSRALAAKQRVEIVATPAAPITLTGASSFLRRHALVLLCVILPTLLATFYFGFYASDIYVSESIYVVRSPHAKSSSGGLGALLGGGGGGGSFTRAQDDIFTINAFVTSRDALDFLNQKLDLFNSWKSSHIDLLHRFNPLGWYGSKEDLFKYYSKRVESIMDPLSGITRLKVAVFSPEEAFQINELLLGLAEQKVNAINSRARNDLIRFAETEVSNAEDKAKKAAVAVSSYRNTQGVVDPEAQTNLHFSHISALQQELVKTRSQLAQLKVFAPNSPHPPALELRQQTLEKEIAQEMANITGGENSLASKAAEFERLRLESEFATQQLASALASLESARNEAQRQQLYLETIAKPKVPDVAILPERFLGVLATFVVCFVIWGVLSMLISGIREHKS
jgi:capsular polysaccharide transport system permease protein